MTIARGIGRQRSRKLLTPTFRRSLETIGWRYVAVKGRNGSRFERIAKAQPLASTMLPSFVPHADERASKPEAMISEGQAVAA
jgi:hypothetical protein